MIKEEFPKHKYTLYGSKPSKLVEGYEHTVEIGIGCPACKHANPPIEHGKTLKCQCGINLTVWGNCLELSK